jgi:hypothetical protein
VRLDIDLSRAVWRKSTRSGSSGNCVQVADNVPGLVVVRDSKDRSGPALAFAPAAWTAFLAALEGGKPLTIRPRRSHNIATIDRFAGRSDGTWTLDGESAAELAEQRERRDRPADTES